jgi:hypothetical protein
MKIAEFEQRIAPQLSDAAKDLFAPLSVLIKRNIVKWYETADSNNDDLDINGMNMILKDELIRVKNTNNSSGGSRRRRRPSRKYKKSSKRVFRKKSRSTRRR